MNSLYFANADRYGQAKSIMLFVLTLFSKTTHMNVISLLQPGEVEQLGGLLPEAICGAFEDEAMDPEKFLVNKEFVEFMHNIIANKGCDLPSLREAAQKQRNGYLYIIDLRTPDGVMGKVPPQDIIGAFKVEDQKLVANSYWRNESHKIFTKNGLVKLPPDLFILVINELKQLGQSE